MSARPLSSCLTAAQLQALADRGVVPADTTCTSPSLNTCLRDANDLLAQYPLYSPTRGIYTAWGEIPLTWEFENDSSDERWQVGEYVDEVGYRIGDEVLVIGNDGLLITLYVAISDGPVPAGSFNPELWSEVCRVVTAEPIGLPNIETIVDRYTYYDPREFLTRWGEYTANWEDDLVAPDSDEWVDAKIAKDFFYRIGDIVLYDSSCNDYTCVYIATADMPSDPNLITPGPPPSTYFSRLYCIPNGRPNTCIKQVSCGPGRVVVDLSGDDTDLVCVPVPYWYQVESVVGE